MIFSFQPVLKEFKLKFFVYIFIFFCFFNNTLIAQDKEIICKGTDTSKWTKCKGSSSSKNGTQYSGEWLDGKLDGYGSFTYKNGDKYQGEFKGSERSGAGIYYFLKDDKFKGHQFEGKYLNDKKSGVGKYIRSNGSYFIGDWTADKINGISFHYKENGLFEKTVIYKDNVFVSSDLNKPPETVTIENYKSYKDYKPKNSENMKTTDPLNNSIPSKSDGAADIPNLIEKK